MEVKSEKLRESEDGSVFENEIETVFVTYNDFGNICRTCLSSTELTEVNDVTYAELQIVDLLSSYTSIQVSNNQILESYHIPLSSFR